MFVSKYFILKYILNTINIIFNEINKILNCVDFLIVNMCKNCHDSNLYNNNHNKLLTDSRYEVLSIVAIVV